MARGRPRSGLPRHPVLPGDPNAALLFDSLHHHGGVSADPADARDGETWMRTDAASAQLWGMHNGVAVLLATPAGVAPSAHASEHHQGGGDPLDLASLAGTLGFGQLPSGGGTWDAGGSTVSLTGRLSVSGSLNAFGGSLRWGGGPFITSSSVIPLKTVENTWDDTQTFNGTTSADYAININSGLARMGFTEFYDVAPNPPFSVASSIMVENLSAEFLDGYLATDFALVSHTHIWADVDKTGSSLADLATRSAADLSSGTLPDLRLSSNVAMRNAANTFTLGQILTRTNTTDVAWRLNTAAGAWYEQLAGGDQAWGQGGSPRDLRLRRTAASEMTIDNNAGGAAKVIFSGETEIDGTLNHDGTTVGFYGVAPVTRAAAITAPTGGATIDNEARTAINAIRTALTNIGITS